MGRCASEPVILSLLRSKCMLILLYAVEACPLLARQIQSNEFTLTRIFMKNFRTGSSNTVNECQVNLAFFLLNMRYLFALLSLCRSLLRLKIVYVNCLLVTRASSYMAFMQFGKKIFKLHVSCAVPFIAFGRSENRRPPKTTADYRRPPQDVENNNKCVVFC